MKLLKLRLSLIVIGLVTTLVVEHRAKNQWRESNEQLKLQLSHMSAPATTNASSQSSIVSLKSATPEILQLRGQLAALRRQVDEMERLKDENYRLRTNRFNNVLRGERLKPEEVAAYLQAKQRSADSLLAAYAATGDRTLLREAMEKSPNDPHVLYQGYFDFRQDMSPQEKRARLEAFKQVAPDNALSGYLSAKEYFNTGQSNVALQEYMAAAQKTKFDDFTRDFVRSLEEVYSSVGFSPIETKILATSSAQYPDLAEIKGLGNNLADMANSYRKSGEEASAQAVTQMAMSLGQRLSDPSANGTIIQELVGLAIERNALKGLNPASVYDSSGRTVSQYLADIDQQREAFKSVANFDLVADLPTMSESDQLEYFERFKNSGEKAAAVWAKTKQIKP